MVWLRLSRRIRMWRHDREEWLHSELEKEVARAMLPQPTRPDPGLTEKRPPSFITEKRLAPRRS